MAFAGVDEEGNLLPEDEGAGLAMYTPARSILGDLLRVLKDYKGHAFLDCWETKDTGEVGPLLQPEETVRLWRAV